MTWVFIRNPRASNIIYRIRTITVYATSTLVLELDYEKRKSFKTRKKMESK